MLGNNSITYNVFHINILSATFHKKVLHIVEQYKKRKLKNGVLEKLICEAIAEDIGDDPKIIYITIEKLLNLHEKHLFNKNYNIGYVDGRYMLMLDTSLNSMFIYNSNMLARTYAYHYANDMFNMIHQIKRTIDMDPNYKRIYGEIYKIDIIDKTKKALLYAIKIFKKGTIFNDYFNIDVNNFAKIVYKMRSVVLNNMLYEKTENDNK